MTKMTFENDIASAKAFLEDEKIESVIRMCVLKQDNGWKRWLDECGNSLILQSNKKISIRASGKEYPETTSDLYRKANYSDVVRISKWSLYICNDINSLHLLYGKDERLRASICSNGRWIKNESPLLAGKDLLWLMADGYIDRKIDISSLKIPKRFGFKPKISERIDFCQIK